MGILGILLLVIFIITSVLLIIIVMIQDEQGEGIGGLFGGGSTTPFGSRSGNILTKATSVMGAVFLICAAFLAYLNKSDISDSDIKREEAIEWWDKDTVDDQAENIISSDAVLDLGLDIPGTEDSINTESEGD